MTSAVSDHFIFSLITPQQCVIVFMNGDGFTDKPTSNTKINKT